MNMAWEQNTVKMRKSEGSKPLYFGHAGALKVNEC